MTKNHCHVMPKIKYPLEMEVYDKEPLSCNEYFLIGLEILNGVVIQLI